MIRRKLLPWEYCVRNMLRRPMRSALTVTALSLVTLILVLLTGFVRGLERSLTTSGDPKVVLVYSLGSEGNIENSSIAAATPGILSASLSGIQRQGDLACVSPELTMGTRICVGGSSHALALVRGVTTMAVYVRRQVRIVEGNWPGMNEVLVGELAESKWGIASRLRPGDVIEMEGRQWTVSGRFAARGSVFESELWCPLEDLRQATKRQDLSLVAVLLAKGKSFALFDLFCKERVDLELQAARESDYYEQLRRHYRPVRILIIVVGAMVGGAGILAGVNTMYGAVAGRTRELATLQAIGFRRRAILIALLMEGTLLAACGSLVATTFAMAFLNGAAVRFTMGAFEIAIDGWAVLVGAAGGLLLGTFGSLPAALRAIRASIVDGLKAV